MSEVMEEQIKRWTSRRKLALVLEIIQGKTTVAAASRQFDLTRPRSRTGLRRASEAWRTPCGRSPRTCASSTSGS